MQNDNTTQSADSVDGILQAESNTATSGLSLGANPAMQQDSSSPQPSTDVTTVDPAPVDNTATTPPAATDDELGSIKNSALEELIPLVDELEQEPEDHYRTLMMLIQASDNEKLLKAAFDAAHKIEDKKIKAQALLTIVNEINYFTDKGEKPEKV